ncbi:MAG: serine/threonine protein kinase, partial [Victivallales bacterium]|nr:serine/threonine protein kinase [Victivallales bacterium]
MSEQLIQTPGVFGENGNFLLERELGSGGMGGVYMGRDKMLDRPVAVKVMLKELGSDPDFVGKFKREAQSAARLIHPNIAQVYSYGICDGMPYIAMELASGGSLYSVMNANPGKTDIARVIKICQQVAQALQCASDQGCVHGDVKPENILLDANGNAKLVDFGLAGMQKDTNEIWGTPYYISPEKVRKEPVDFRADMYSLGGTLYHALTGVAPFEGEDAIAVVKQRFNGPPKKPSEIRPELTPAIDELVMKMLALEKENRYPSFEALLEAFKDVLTTGLTKKVPNPTAKPAGGTTVGNRMNMRTRRAIRPGMRPGTSIKRKPPSGESGDEGALDETEKPSHSDDDEDDEENGGNLGLKVVGVVVGVIVLIAAVVGGLVWYQISAKNARERELQTQIAEQTTKATDAIADTIRKANAFADDFDVFAKRAVEECEKPTAELTKMLPPEHAALLKPGPTKELLDAIASTNDAAPVVAAQAAPAPATNAAPAAATNAAPAQAAASTNAAPAKAAAAAKKGDKKQAAKTEAKTEKPEEKKPEQPPEVVVAMNELWEHAYTCQACAIRIRKSVRDLVKKSAEADAYREPSRENMEKLGEISRALVDMFEQIKGSKDVETVKKGISYIKSKGEKTVEQTVKRLRIEKLEAERKAKAEAAAEAEKARQAKLAEERKALIEEETKAAQDKFDLISAQGCFRQQDWKTALRLLDSLRSECKTAEGQLAVDLQVRKVNSMAKLYSIFIKNMP